jgi:hypothetical protein
MIMLKKQFWLIGGDELYLVKMQYYLKITFLIVKVAIWIRNGVSTLLT